MHSVSLCCLLPSLYSKSRCITRYCRKHWSMLHSDSVIAFRHQPGSLFNAGLLSLCITLPGACPQVMCWKSCDYRSTSSLPPDHRTWPGTLGGRDSGHWRVVVGIHRQQGVAVVGTVTCEMSLERLNMKQNFPQRRGEKTMFIGEHAANTHPTQPAAS